MADLSVGLQKYAGVKSDIVEVERYILRELGFILHVDHPHKSVLNYLKVLDAEPRLMQEAWNLTNDRYADYAHPWRLHWSRRQDCNECDHESMKVVKLLSPVRSI